MDLRKIFLVGLRLLVFRDYRYLRRLKIFDSGYYLSFFPDGTTILDPLAHYLRHWREAVSGMEGGVAEPHPLFDSRFYRNQCTPGELEVNPLLHYLKLGWKKGYWPGPYLDPETYCRNHGVPEGDTAGVGNPLLHCNRTGGTGQIPAAASPYFDPAYLCDRLPQLEDIAKQGIVQLVKHYSLHLAGIDRSPIPLFDSRYFRERCGSEVVGRDALVHYLVNRPPGIRPAPTFDPDFVARTAMATTERGWKPRGALAAYLVEGVHRRWATDRSVADVLDAGPTISILVPVYNPQIRHLNSCIRSVLFQAYPKWQLCLANDGSTAPGVRETLEYWQGVDQRIQVVHLDHNQGISGATNSCAQLARGEFLAFLDNDDELRPDCLLRVTEEIVRKGARLVYTDEDLVGDDGTPLSIFRKPSYNQELLLSHNYITHFVVVEKSLFDRVGGCSPECDGAQDYDLLLKLTEQVEEIHHIPLPLYHWRASESSTSINHSSKSYAHEAGKVALTAALERRGVAARVEDSDLNYFYRLRYRNRLGDGNTVLRLDHSAGIDGIAKQIERNNSPFLFFGTSLAGTVPESCLEELLGWAGAQDVGMVCGRLRPGGEDGPSYSLPDVEDREFESWKNFLVYGSRHQQGMHCSQRIWCCDPGCTLVNRAAFDQVGGFDPEFSHLELAMLDLSFRMRKRGFVLIYTPEALITDDATVSPASPPAKEWELFRHRYRDELLAGDPWYNLQSLKDHSGAETTIRQFQQWFAGPV